MKKLIGKVIDVSIPKQYKNNNLLDVMDRNNITFKVVVDNGLIEITVEQDEENANIMKNDTVEIIEQIISGKEFIDIKLYTGEEDE